MIYRGVGQGGWIAIALNISYLPIHINTMRVDCNWIVSNWVGNQRVFPGKVKSRISDTASISISLDCFLLFTSST